MSRSVRFRRDSPSGGSHYDHQRSDSGVGSFSDCESRISNPDRDYLAPGYEDQRALYSLRQERDALSAKVAALEDELKQTRNELELTKAQTRGLANQNELLDQEKTTLTKANKELTEEVAELQDTIKELKKANRKSSSGSSPSTSSATPSESSDDKKLRRSSSKRHKESSGRAEKEKEREREREREKDREKERERERRKEKERAEKEETERLRKRFDTRGDESDAKSSITSTKSRLRRDSYIEPLGHGAPRPQAPIPPSPSRQYSSYTTTTSASQYPPAPSYPNIREPYTGSTPRTHHPSVYVSDDYTYGVVEEEDPYHQHPIPRTTRHAR